MEIELPSGLLGIIKKKLEELIFLKAYTLSHNDYLRYTSKLRFKNLADHVDYDLELESAHISNEDLPMSKLFVRTQKENYYDGFRGYVKAINGNICYQNPVTIKLERKKQVIIIHLPNIPLKDIYISENSITTTYNEVLITGVFFGKNVEDYSIEKSYGFPNYTEFLNSNWNKKWGIVWNLDFLENHYSEMKHALIYKLAGPLAFMSFGPKNNKRFANRMERYWCSFVVNVIANEKLLRMYWWSTMPFRIKKLKKHIEKQSI